MIDPKHLKDYLMTEEEEKEWGLDEVRHWGINKVPIYNECLSCMTSNSPWRDRIVTDLKRDVDAKDKKIKEMEAQVEAKDKRIKELEDEVDEFWDWDDKNGDLEAALNAEAERARKENEREEKIVYWRELYIESARELWNIKVDQRELEDLRKRDKKASRRFLCIRLLEQYGEVVDNSKGAVVIASIPLIILTSLLIVLLMPVSIILFSIEDIFIMFFKWLRDGAA